MSPRSALADAVAKRPDFGAERRLERGHERRRPRLGPAASAPDPRASATRMLRETSTSTGTTRSRAAARGSTRTGRSTAATSSSSVSARSTVSRHADRAGGTRAGIGVPRPARCGARTRARSPTRAVQQQIACPATAPAAGEWRGSGSISPPSGGSRRARRRRRRRSAGPWSPAGAVRRTGCARPARARRAGSA